jgi:hypothetical protein
VSRYVKRVSGDGWTVKNREVFRIGCCDCGLVHKVVLHVRGRRRGFLIGIAAEVDSRATAQKRRKRK